VDEHSLFYYPYASVTEDQDALLRMTALYFDKLYMLDPYAAVVGPVPGIGIRPSGVARAVRLLEDRGLAKRLDPAVVLKEYGSAVKHAVDVDLRDETFLELCRKSGRVGWELALAKVPADLLREEAMRKLLKGPYARTHHGRWDSSDAGLNYYEDEAWEEQLNTGNVYDESFVGSDERYDFRWALFKIEAGESIIINHAILASLSLLRATAVTDDKFHRTVFEHKMQDLRIHSTIPEISDDDESIRQNNLAYAFLSEQKLQLPYMSSDVPLEIVIEFREDRPEELEKARVELYWLARSIVAEPFTSEFQQHLNREVIPNLRNSLKAVEAARDTWLRNRRLARLKAAGAVMATIGTGLGLIFAPVAAPIVAGAAALALLGGTARDAPSVVEALQRNPKQSGLSYFLEKPTH
jgi:hypothetical protein